MIEDFKNSIPKNEELITEKVGIGGFTMYVSIAESVTKTATVTTNPIESGSNINDHIIKNPISLTIEGEIADVFIETQPLQGTVQNLLAPIGIVQDYLPARTQTQISKVNGLLSNLEDFFDKADKLVNQGTQLYNFFSGAESEQTISQKFLTFFDKVYDSNSKIDVNCIDKKFKDMVITSFTTSKINTNNFSFNITLQNIIEVETTLFKLTKNASGDARSQGALLADKGTQQAKKIDKSFASSLLGAFK